MPKFKRRSPVEGATVIKDRVEVAKDTATPAVVDSKPGPVTFADKVKYYYKFIIAAVGAFLVLLNQITPIFSFLPGSYKEYLTIAITFVTALGVFLKSNEQWVERL